MVGVRAGARGYGGDAAETQDRTPHVTSPARGLGSRRAGQGRAARTGRSGPGCMGSRRARETTRRHRARRGAGHAAPGGSSHRIRSASEPRRAGCNARPPIGLLRQALPGLRHPGPPVLPGPLRGVDRHQDRPAARAIDQRRQLVRRRRRGRGAGAAQQLPPELPLGLPRRATVHGVFVGAVVFSPFLAGLGREAGQGGGRGRDRGRGARRERVPPPFRHRRHVAWGFCRRRRLPLHPAQGARPQATSHPLAPARS